VCDLAGVTIPKHVEGKSLRSLLADPSSNWDQPALTTHGYKNHALRSEKYRLIHYEDGSEELYDEVKDPYEWTNIAADPKSADIKFDLARSLPPINQEPGATRRALRARRNQAK